MTSEPQTYFAPRECATPNTIAAQNRLLATDPIVAPMLDSFPEPAVVLNRHRQIVLANDKLEALLERSRESLLGLRPGEAFGCVHSRKTPGCCGTTQFCRYCGGTRAIVDSQNTNTSTVEECRLLCSGGDGVRARDLRVWANPVAVRGEQFTVFAVRDTTDEKRRAVLERLFFHDIINAAGTLKTIIGMWTDLSSQQADEMRRMAKELTDQLLEEIQAQRDLAAAERGDLTVEFEEVDVAALLAGLCEVYGHEAVATGKTIARPRIEGATALRSAPVILRRVLGNLIKNALEASATGDTVTVSFEHRGVPTFRVHNPGVISEAVRAQLFQRSFTTKDGSGRGVGTYSVKLFVENYLHGTATFHSTAEAGTTFIVTLPAEKE